MNPETSPSPRPLPRAFLEWQVALRRDTVEKRGGTPHVGVAPLVTARRPGVGPGFVSHSVICGLLPHPRLLSEKTEEMRKLYEAGIGEGERALRERGLRYLLDYYCSADDFDPESLTTLLPAALPLVGLLRAAPRCGLVFHVFELRDSSEVGRLRCLQLDADAELLASGPIYDNVRWHNALFHGLAEDQVVVRFRHEDMWDTRFGALERVT